MGYVTHIENMGNTYKMKWINLKVGDILRDLDIEGTLVLT